ncbi:receptor like protein 24, partial [Quercus suber]
LLPLSIFDLPNLSVLYLHHNQLVGPLPNHVSGLNLLICLSLSSNFLNGTLPSWLFCLTSLENLHLDHNQFIGEIGEFKCNNSLEHLDLSYNMLQGSIPSTISRLVNLTYLYLSSNNLSIMLDLELLSNLNNLNVLDFSYNNILVSINNNLTFTLPNLEELYLSSCNISEFPIFLRTATNLLNLDLSNNRIHGQTPKWLGALVKVNFLPCFRGGFGAFLWIYRGGYRGKDSGENKGFAFVTFRSAELAPKAIDELNNTEFKIDEQLASEEFIMSLKKKSSKKWQEK